VRNPSRYIIVTQICFGISAGYGAFALCRRLRKSGPFLKIKKHAVVLLCLLVSLFHMAELTLFPYPSSNPRHCPFYMVMRGDPDDVAVLDCPFHPGLQCYMYFTHLHRKRAVHGFGGRVWFPELRRHEDPYYIDKYLNETPVDAMPSYVERLAAGLEGANVRYVNIHKWLYSHPSSWKRIARFLEDSRFWKNRGNVRIEPVYEDGDNLIYRVFWRDREEQGMEGKGEARMEGKSPVGGE